MKKSATMKKEIMQMYYVVLHTMEVVKFNSYKEKFIKQISDDKEMMFIGSYHHDNIDIDFDDINLVVIDNEKKEVYDFFYPVYACAYREYFSSMLRAYCGNSKLSVENVFDLEEAMLQSELCDADSEDVKQGYLGVFDSELYFLPQLYFLTEEEQTQYENIRLGYFDYYFDNSIKSIIINEGEIYLDNDDYDELEQFKVDKEAA